MIDHPPIWLPPPSTSAFSQGPAASRSESRCRAPQPVGSWWEAGGKMVLSMNTNPRHGLTGWETWLDHAEHVLVFSSQDLAWFLKGSLWPSDTCLCQPRVRSGPCGTKGPCCSIHVWRLFKPRAAAALFATQSAARDIACSRCSASCTSFSGRVLVKAKAS